MRPTAAWINQYVKPRLTERDRKILRFVHDHRIVTSEQIARLFWPNCSNAQRLCNRRLQILAQLRCLDRYYPLIHPGKSCQHLVLDVVGAKVLGLEGWRKITKLPSVYRHQVLVAEFVLRANQLGLEGGIIEYPLGPVRSDLYYPAKDLAVEVDTGTTSPKQLVAKAQRYRRIKISQVVMVTEGANHRLKAFFDTLGYGVGAHYDHLDKLLRTIIR